MLTSRQVYNQIFRLTTDFISTGICDDQNFPIISRGKNGVEDIDIGQLDTTIFLKSIPYSEMYKILRSKRAFNIKMIDGALILLQYRFINNSLISHRLSFFPSPNLNKFQNEPEIYIEDEIYADILDKRIVTVPLRFDFDSREGVAVPVIHPMSHLTIGQYKNCRIPVTSALTPYHFLTFIITNFYHTAATKYGKKLSICNELFKSSIFPEEKAGVHMHTPCDN